MATEIDLRTGATSHPPRSTGGFVADRSDRGRDASSPTDIPAKGWKDVLMRTYRETKEDHAVLLAAGVAFFGLLALVPAMIALVSVYGLVSDPSEVTRQVGDLLGAAPSEVRDLVEKQLRAVAEDTSGSISFGLAGGLALALWSASSGMKHLIDALNSAYDETEGRGFFKVRGLALLFTIGAIIFVVASVFVITVVPALLDGSALGDAARTAVQIARWPLLASAFGVGLALLYRYGPSRDEARWRWVSPGAIFATALWLIASGLFSVYAANFGSYNETYGSLGGVVVVMLWLFITSFVVILGAELDSEIERQTAYDTTEGRDEPMGQRGAYAADTVGQTAEQAKVEHDWEKATANR